MTGVNSYKFSGHMEIRGTLWSKYMLRASKRNIPFTVRIEDAWELFEKQERKCVLSGIPILFGGSHPLSDTTASLDRLDPSLGYIIENVQWVHKIVNMMRWTLSVNEFVNWCSLVTQRAALTTQSAP
jgi:hypothetical protein